MTEQTTTSTLVHSAKPPPGTRVIVDVFARNENGPVEFTHAWRWEDGTPGDEGTIVVPRKKKGESATPIDFHLRDETNPLQGFVFTADVNGPMWVKRNTCPGQQCEDPEIPPKLMKRTDKKLSVVDLNQEDCELHYRLRFQDKDGMPDSYDPDIRNGGTNLAGPIA
jgi:hypothetical protein